MRGPPRTERLSGNEACVVGRLDEELVPVSLDDRLQLLDLLRGGLRIGWRREGAARRGLARRPNHILDAARDQDEEHAATLIADREAMGYVARPEDVVARACLDDRVADLKGDVPLEDPEALVVAAMHVERRLGAWVLRDLHDGHLSA